MDAITDRLMHRLQYRSFNGFSTLVAITRSMRTAPTTPESHWFELSNSGTGWTLNQEVCGRAGQRQPLDGKRRHGFGRDIALGYSVSGPGTYPSIDTPAGLFPILRVNDAGRKHHHSGRRQPVDRQARWGDYSGMAVDLQRETPADRLRFLVHHRIHPGNGQRTWLTRVGAFSLLRAVWRSAWRLAGHDQRQFLPLPIADATVRVQPGGFTTTTDANGHYDLTIAVGTYDVTASDSDMFSKTASSIGVTDGGTSTQDFALDPAPHVTVAGTVADGSGHGWPLYARIDIAVILSALYLPTLSPADTAST